MAYRMIILLTGMPGSGKEEFIKVAEDMGIYVIRMGDVVRDFVRSLSLPLNDNNVGRIANSEREKNGMDIWARRTLERIGTGNYIIDGVRNWEEVEFFKKYFGENMKIVAILSSPDTRFKRLLKRGRMDDPKSFEEFLKRDNREMGWGLAKVIANADFFIVNESSLEDFKESVRNLLKRFKD